MEEGYGLHGRRVRASARTKRPQQKPWASAPEGCNRGPCGSPGIHPRHKSNACAAGFSPRGTRREAGVSIPATPPPTPKGFSPGSNPPVDPPPPQPCLRSVSTPAHPRSRQRLVTGHGFSHAECRAFLRNEGDGLHGRRVRASWKKGTGFMEEGYGLHGRRVRASWKKGTGFSPYKKVPTKTVGFSPRGRQSTYRAAARGFIPGTSQTHAPRASAREEPGGRRGFQPQQTPPPTPKGFSPRKQRSRRSVPPQPCVRSVSTPAHPRRAKAL